MKKIIVTMLCAAILLSGCGAVRQTMNEETQTQTQEKLPYEQLSGEGTGWGFVRKK